MPQASRAIAASTAWPRSLPLLVLLLFAAGCQVAPAHYYSGGGYGLVNETGNYVPSVALPEPVLVPLDPVPARVAVAELGEWLPPKAVVAALRRHRRLFSEVTPIAGRGPTSYYGTTPLGPSLGQSTGAAVDQVIGTARDSGVHCVLLLTARTHTTTPDAIRGVPPEQQGRPPSCLSQWTEGDGVAVLVDVRDGKVLCRTVASGLRKDPTVLPGTKQWFWGRPATLLAESLMTHAANRAAHELAERSAEARP